MTAGIRADLPNQPARIMFLYWGRRGALAQFTLEVGRAAVADDGISPTICISRQNENFERYRDFGPSLFPIDTFQTGSGALLQSWRIPLLRRQLYERIMKDRIQAVIELMPHAWSPLVMQVVRAAGAQYCTIIHDANAHQGDHTGWVKKFTDRSLSSADLVLTLSEAVAGRLVATGAVPKSKLFTLFHPDLHYGIPQIRNGPQPQEPLRVLFLGRIMAYKGLPMLLDAIELLREEGIAVEIGVFGEGRLGAAEPRLRAMGAEVVNRWLDASEIGPILARHHAVILSHSDASQSGVAAAAFGAGLPVVATPVGGLIEQIQDGTTGSLALRADAPALASAIKRLLLDPEFYQAISANIIRTRESRSMAKFVKDSVSHVMYASPGRKKAIA
jgi:glycosyltransferase involved in cell wall biosynthesis